MTVHTRLIGTIAIAEYLQRGQRTIWRWYKDRHRNGIPIVKVGRTYEAETRDLDEWRRNPNDFGCH